jgi:hypothetical protein
MGGKTRKRAETQGKEWQVREGQARRFKTRYQELYAEVINTYMSFEYMQQHMTECMHCVYKP